MVKVNQQFLQPIELSSVLCYGFKKCFQKFTIAMSDEALIYAGGFQMKNAVSVRSVEKRCLWKKSPI